MKLYKLFFLAIVLLGLGACEKEQTFLQYEDAEKGIYARRLSGPTGAYDGAFNFNDVAGSDVSFSVEFYDENNGQGVAEYNWDVSYSGRPDLGAARVLSITSFGTSAKGRPSAEFSFSFQQALDALGLAFEDVDGGEFFSFDATIVTTDGRRFTRTNTGSNVISSAPFGALFTHRANIICPSELDGVYDAATTGAGPWGCTNTWSGQVEFVQTGNGEYQIYAYGDGVHERDLENPDFSMGAYWACYGDGATLPGGTLKMVDACNNLSFSGASRWGEIYTYNLVEANGSDLTIDWVNDYGEGGITVLTRTDGTDWPPMSF